MYSVGDVVKIVDVYALNYAPYLRPALDCAIITQVIHGHEFSSYNIDVVLDNGLYITNYGIINERNITIPSAHEIKRFKALHFICHYIGFGDLISNKLYNTLIYIHRWHDGLL